jgi:two-component system sensor histidine kinase ChiS
LIVDDTPANLGLLAQMLRRRGYKVRVADDGPSAIASARANPPDLLLLDIMMPGMSGYQVCAELKTDAMTCAIPVIFLSALGETEDKVKAFTAGGVDYITKPFHMEEVVARVQTHLMLRDLQKQLEVANHDLEQRVQVRTAELAALNAAYASFVPREFLDFLHKPSVLEVRLGDQVQREMTIMFSDIRDFTARSERLTPQENFNFLNAYLGRISPSIGAHGGIVDKYLGDGIMALFPGAPDAAVQAALAMQRAVEGYNRELAEPITIGIGLHTGSLILGIIGDERRKQGTVISDAVNLAARLEGLCKVYGAAIIASAQVVEQISQSEYAYRFIDQVQVRGKREPVSLFEILDSTQERKLHTKRVFEKGLQLYYALKFTEATANFTQVLEHDPTDRAAQIYIERATQFMASGVPAGWTGIEKVE